MTEETAMTQAPQTPSDTPRKPCLALMGEFSAGKSTLSKLLLGDAPLPVRVTATRLPPIWISQGNEAAFAVAHDGSETPLDISDLDKVRLEDTRMIRLYNPSETLEICDIIDMPGISDPNMSSDVWLSVMEHVDSVVWCTGSTQAWRQSEAATWAQIAGRTNGDNILLVTQIDKLRSERDKARVMMRVTKETEGQFKAVYPLSILAAIEAGEDEVKWTESGAAAFVDHLVDLLLAPTPKPSEPAPGSLETAAAEPPPVAANATPAQPDSSGIMPKRVRVLTEMRGRTPRPTRAELEEKAKLTQLQEV
jgi:hypothetical protein